MDGGGAWPAQTEGDIGMRAPWLSPWPLCYQGQVQNTRQLIAVCSRHQDSCHTCYVIEKTKWSVMLRSCSRMVLQPCPPTAGMRTSHAALGKSGSQLSTALLTALNHHTVNLFLWHPWLVCSPTNALLCVVSTAFWGVFPFCGKRQFQSSLQGTLGPCEPSTGAVG